MDAECDWCTFCPGINKEQKGYLETWLCCSSSRLIYLIKSKKLNYQEGNAIQIQIWATVEEWWGGIERSV